MSILNNGEYQDFAYTGNIQTFVVAKEGLYKLEGWGARGGIILTSQTSGAGGYGAYICGYKYLYRDDVLYLGVGGAGTDSPIVHTVGDLNGGYNGGGKGNVGTYLAIPTEVAGGGGCTHIATSNGLIKNLSQSNILLCASGGGGGARFDGWGLTRTIKGGNGGINTGRSGEFDSHEASLSPTVHLVKALGGTQTAGGQTGSYSWDSHQVNGEWFPSGSSVGTNGAYGQGGALGGGGGYYGGGGGVCGFHDFSPGQPDYFGACCSGAGGSSYYGGVPSITHKGIVYAPTTQEQVNYDNGKVRITLIDKASTDIYIGDSLLIQRKDGDTQITKMFYGDMDISIN